MRDHAELIEFYRGYGASSFADDEPAYAEVCEHLGDHPELVELIAAHDPDAQQPNLLFAAVHFLLLGGLDHPLQAVYAGTSADPVTPTFVDLVLSNREVIDDLLQTRRTQTNEVGRCATISLMLGDAFRRAGQPLAWIDLGASAGLNLNIDHFGIDYRVGGRMRSTGPADAALRLSCDVRNGSPEISSRHGDIAWRIGVDRSPIDVRDADQARWLQACLWPSQPERHERMRTAIAIARAHPWPMIEADAVDGLRQAIALAPTDAALVMTTTWVWYYLPPATRHAITDMLRNCDRRVRWYSSEGRGIVEELGQSDERQVIDSMVGRVELGGGDADTSAVLGLTHPHGAWLDWYE